MTEQFHNPVVPYNSLGEYSNTTRRSGYLQEPMILHVDSEYRGGAYTNACDFKMRMPSTISSVHSIELLNISIPTPNPCAGYVLFLDLGPDFKTMLSMQSTDATTSVNTTANNAFCKLLVNPGQPVQIWQRSHGNRFIKRFDGKQIKIGDLTFKVKDKYGDIYDIGENEWNATFEIVGLA
jgi:hypothetical protein